MSAWQPTGAPADAGWRPDPTGRFEQRLWNGRRWTPRVRVGQAEAIETDAPAPRGGDATWRPDPTARFEQRLWRGGRWTRRVRVGEAEAVDTLSVPGRARPTREDRRADAAGPGWRPDPDDPARERFWDGRQLTVKSRPAGSRRERARLRWWAHPAVLVAAVLALLAVTLVALVLLWLLG